MSSNVDERIVRMEFDDSSLESGANKAIGILEKLNNALKFGDATSGLDEVRKSVSNFSMDSVSNSVDACSNKFDAFGAMATGVFLNIGSKIADFGLNMGKKLTLQPLMDGFSEYQLQMNSVQTILSNTGDKLKEAGITDQADQVAVINEYLDELNTYADKTIYNFAQMTKNIGTFTAAGVDLDVATKSIQGIANLAAASGSNSQQASTAMYQLSQAIAAGSVKLQDWNSVVNAGMGGELFQESLKRTARNHGIAVDEMIEKAGSFRESLKEGWITSDVLTDTLEQMTMAYEEVGDEAYEANWKILKSKNYTDEEARAILDLAKNAQEAATKVRTWNQLWETVGEALGSGWASTWRIVVGDFLEATDLFTFLSDRITGLIGASADARNAVLSDWSKAGGRTALVDGIKFLVDSIVSPIKTIGTAFSEVFGITGEQIYNISVWFASFAEKLVPSQRAVDYLYDVFFNLFTIIHSVMGVGGNLIRSIGSIAKAFWKLAEPIVYVGLSAFGALAEAFARFASKIHLWSDYFESSIYRIFTPIRYIFRNSIQNISAFITAFKNVFGNGFVVNAFKSVGNSISSMRDRFKILKTLSNWVKKFVSKLWDINRAVFTFGGRNGTEKIAFFEEKLKELSENPVFSTISKGIGWVSDKFTWLIDLVTSSASKVSGALGSVKDSVSSFLGTFLVPIDFSGWFDSIKTGPIIDKIGGFFSSFDFGPKLSSSLDDTSKSLEVASKSISEMSEVSEDGSKGIQKSFKSLISKAFNKLPAPVKKAGSAIKSFGEKVASFVTDSKAFQTVKKALSDFTGKETFTFVDVLVKIKDAIVENFGKIKTYFESFSLGKLFDDISSKFSEFSKKLNLTIPDFGVSLGEKIGSIKDAVVGLFSKDESGELGAKSLLTGALANLPEEIRSLYDQIVNSFDYGNRNIQKEAGQLSLDNAVQNAGLFTETVAGIPAILGSAIDNITTLVQDFLKAFQLPSVEELLSGGLVVTFIGFARSLTKVNTSLSNIITGFVAWPDKLGNALKQIGAGFNEWRKETKADAVIKIAIGIGILAGSLFLLASIPSDDLIRAGKAMGIIAGSVIGILTVFSLIDKLPFVKNDTTLKMLNLGMAIQSFGIGVAAFAAACLLISAIPVEDLDKSIDTVTTIAVTLAIMAAAIGQNGKSVAKGARSFIFMAAGVWVMAKAIESIGNMDTDAIEKAMPTFAGIIAALSIFGAIGAKGIAEIMRAMPKFAIGIGIFAASLVVLAAALNLANMYLEDIGFAEGGMSKTLMVLGSSLIAFTAICLLLKSADPLGTSLAILAFSGAIAILAASVVVLSSVQDLEGTMNLLLMLGLLIGEFAVIANGFNASDLLVTAGSIALFAASLGIMAIAVNGLSSVGDMDKSMRGLKALALMLAEFAIISKVSGGFSLLAAGAGMLLFSGAVLILAKALLEFEKVKPEAIGIAIVSIAASFGILGLSALILAPLAPILITVATAFLIFSASVFVIAASIRLLTDSILSLEGYDANTIAEKLGGLGRGLGQMLLNMFVDAFTSVYNWVVENRKRFAEMFVTFVNAAVEKLGEFGSWIAENAPTWIQNLISGFSESLPKIIETLKNVFNTAVEALAPIAEEFGKLAIEAKDKFIAYITSDEFRAKAAEIKDKFIEELGKLKDKAIEVGKNAIQGLIDGVNAKLEPLLTAASNIVNGFLEKVHSLFDMNSPSKVMSDIGANVTQGLIDGIKSLVDPGLVEAAGTLFTTIGDKLSGIPSFIGSKLGGIGTVISTAFGGTQTAASNGAQSVVTTTSDKLGGLKTEFGKRGTEGMSALATSITKQISTVKASGGQVVTSGVKPGLAKTSEVFGKSGTEGVRSFSTSISGGASSARSAASGVAASAKSGASGFSLYDTGSNLVDGFVRGIKNNEYKAINAAVGMVSASILNARKTAQVKSPSRVFMKIGGYIAEGFAIGIRGGIKDAGKAGTDLAAAVPEAFSDSLNSMSFNIEDILDTDYNPVISPVIDPTEFNYSLASLNSSLNSGLTDNLNIGNVNYSGEIVNKLGEFGDYNKQALQAFADNAIDYNQLGNAVAGALIASGVHVEIDGGKLMGYLAGEIQDARRMYK